MADTVFSFEIRSTHHHPMNTISMEISTQQTLSVNGNVRPFNASLSTILCDFGVDVENARGVAVAVNDEVVRRSNWQSFLLSPDDRVEIVTARQGG